MIKFKSRMINIIVKGKIWINTIKGRFNSNMCVYVETYGV